MYEYITDSSRLLVQHTICSMKESTAAPALTSIITRRGFLSLEIMSLIDVAPITFVPLASFSRNCFTLATVRLYAQTYIIARAALYIFPPGLQKTFLLLACIKQLAVNVHPCFGAINNADTCICATSSKPILEIAFSDLPNNRKT